MVNQAREWLDRNVIRERSNGVGAIDRIKEGVPVYPSGMRRFAI
jgi:hypothetical protein